MSTNIESLQIQVKSDATAAVSGLNSLSNSLSKLRSATNGGLGLTKVSEELKDLNSALKTLKKSKSAINSLDGLSRLKNVKISPTIGKNLNSIATSLQSFGKINISKGISQVNAVANALTSLSASMKGTTPSLNSMYTKLSKLSASINGVSSSAASASKGKGFLSRMMSMVGTSFSVGQALQYVIGESASYNEALNLFTQSMGQYAEEAGNYAQKVSDLLGIDMKDWMNYQGVFNTIINGFGVATADAYKMSKSLTTLGYDISSYFNIPVQDAMLKLQSGISGELEPLRRLGYDLSVARLQQEAYNLGINRSVNSMTQAEKAQLRYHAIMTQVTQSHNDLTRTLNAPANQLRILQARFISAARAIGNIFIPILNLILPYAIAAAKAIEYVASAIAAVFGFELVTPEWTSNVGAGAASVGNLADNLGGVGDSGGAAANGLNDAAKAAKKLKNATIGIDELNIISPDEPTSGTGGGGSGGGGGAGGIGGTGDLGIPLEGYEWDLNKIVDNEAMEIFEKLKKHLGNILRFATGIGAAFASWKVAKNFLKFVEKLERLLSLDIGKGKLVGFLSILSDINEFSYYLDLIGKEGASILSVGGLISQFVGMIGDSLTIMGNFKFGGAFKVIQGIGEFVVGIQDIMRNGLDWENARATIRGLSNVVLGIGIFTQNASKIGAGFMIQGLITAIYGIKDVVEAIKTGDWSDVNWSDILMGIVEFSAGLIAFSGKYSKISETLGKIKKKFGAGKELDDAADTFKKMSEKTDTIGDTTSTLDTSTGNVSPKLKGLAKNLGLGALIVGEVAVIAMGFTGAIIVLGKELEAVGKAWQPVIENQESILTGLTLGTVFLTVFGAAANALGENAGSLIVNLLLGTAILLGVGGATILFAKEITSLGNNLAKVGEAWNPVIANGDAVTSGLLNGVSYIVGFAALSGILGLLLTTPAGMAAGVAIGVGALVLLGITSATVSFVNKVADLGNAFAGRLAPALARVNAVMPSANTHFTNFTHYLKGFADNMGSFTLSMAETSLMSLVNDVVEFFTGNPIDKMADKVGDIAEDASRLVSNLNKANPFLQQAVRLLTDFQSYLKKIGYKVGDTDGNGSDITCSIDISIKLTKKNWSTVAGFIGKTTDVYVGVKLRKENFTTVEGFIGRIKTLSQKIGLKKSGWTTVKSWIGSMPTLYQKIGLSKSGWSSLSSWIGTNSARSVKINLVRNNFKSLSDFIGDSITVSVKLKNGWDEIKFKTISSKAMGGILKNGVWKDIPQYAGGTLNAGMHGSMFIAGENGAEMVGHINGQTEVLNRSQIAMAMRSAVISGMSQFVDYWRAMYSQMTVCSNGIIRAMAINTNVVNRQLAMQGVGAYEPSTGLSNMVYEDTQTKTGDNFSEEVLSKAMRTFYQEYVEPTLRDIAADTKRQADKEEQTVVQIGNRVVSDAVTTQRKANGYSFVK